jgi:hypothetical protein
LNDDTTSKRSSNTSIISHQSGGSGSGIKAATVCQDEIIVEINSKHESNENSDLENGDLMQDDEDDEEEANSEQKLLKSSKSELITVKAQVEIKHNGVCVNGFDELCLKIKMGW